MEKTKSVFQQRCLAFLILIFLSGISEAFAQQEIKGKVTDRHGPVPGATIRLKDTKLMATSDSNGDFIIKTTVKQGVLIFSFTGYKTAEIQIDGRAIINVTLEELVSVLDEVIAIGYGTIKKGDLTGATGSMKLNKTEEQSYSSFDQMLSGRVAGVSAYQSSGEPGSGVVIEVRGANSISTSTRPLYVIDGIPIEEPKLGSLVDTYASANVTNPLAAINPNDIETIDVLKDASATAIYGSRGANGVVLITTKSAKSGAAVVNFNYSTSVASLINPLKMLNSEQYAALSNEISINRGNSVIPFTNEELQNLPEYDHFNEVSQNALTYDAGFSVSSGDKVQKVYFSGQYYKQDGVILNSDLTRYSGLFKYERKINDKLVFNTNIKLSQTSSRGTYTAGGVSSRGIIQDLITWAPTSPLVNPDGSYNNIASFRYGKDRFATQNADITQYENNPIAEALGYYNRNSSFQLIGSAGLTYNITKRLSANAKLGTTIYNSLLEGYRPSYIFYNPTDITKGYASSGTSSGTKMLYEGTLDYKNTFNKKHDLTVLLGTTLEDYTQKVYKAASSNFVQDITGVFSMQGGSTPSIPFSDYSNYALLSFLGRVNYTYNGKYLLTISGRYDGSSKFGDNNKFGFFPSAAIAWKIDKEKFFVNHLRAIDEFKLRLSYGVTGNQSLPPYQSIPQLNTGNRGAVYNNPIFGNAIQSGYSPLGLPNEDLKWETTTQFNVGLDIGVFKNRIKLSADAYYKKTDDLLLDANIPSSSGFSTVFMNIGAIENKGLEFTLSTVNVAKSKFKWNSDFNISFNRNKLLALTGGNNTTALVGAILNVPLAQIQVGRQVGEFYGYVTDGIWNAQTLATKPSTFMVGARAGDRRYADINGDGILNQDDRVYMGSSIPKYYGGINNNFRYGNVELDVFFNFSYGANKLNLIRWTTESLNGILNQSAATVDRWTPDNLDAKYPAAGNYTNAREIYDDLVENSSFIRCKNISISYFLPKSLLGKLKLKSAKIYGGVQNLFIIDSYSGFSAESVPTRDNGINRGIDQGIYPDSRTFKFGLNLNL